MRIARIAHAARSRAAACVLVSLFVLAGCASDSKQKLVSAKNVITMKSVSTLYATDRAPASEGAGDEPFYSSARGELVFGDASVDVPIVGPSEEDSAGLKQFGNVRIRNATVVEVEQRDTGAFVKVLRQAVASSTRRELMLFVHGYNTSFDEALRRTSQLAWETRFDGAAMLFSWPSKKGVTGYTADEAAVNWATTHLRHVVKLITSESGAQRIVLVAHSMGSRALVEAVTRIERETGVRDAIRHIVLAAPDIDADVFRRDIAPALSQPGRRVTLYASSRDRALKLSEQLHDYPRAGNAGTAPMIIAGIDTIDVSAVDSSFLGHNYYGENVPIVADLRELIRNDTPTDERFGMEAKSLPGGRYWLLKEPEIAAQ